VDTVNVTIAGKIRPYSGLTPNNDGHNDFWIIDNIQAYPGVQVSVFNRWGERVFFSKKYDNETEVFNGTRNGKPLPEGTYYYIIESKDGSNRTSGPLTIMR
jgi:gliding motility-associated-like protein